MAKEADEESLLLGRTQNHGDGEQRRNGSLRVVGGVIASVALFSLGALSRNSLIDEAKSVEDLSIFPTSNFVTLADSSLGMPGLKVTNKYIEADGPEARPSMYPWLKGRTLLEPFKATTFTAIDAMDEIEELGAESKLVSLSNGLSYSWSIKRPEEDQNKFEVDLKQKRRTHLAQNRGLSSAEVDAAEPPNGPGGHVKSFVATSALEPLVHTFTELGVHHVTLDVEYKASSSKDGSKVNNNNRVLSQTAQVVVKYVRREMHTVDDEDREALFAAWKVLLDTDDDTGVATYGSDFRSHQRLSAEHNNLAGEKGCDHLHDGMGFLPGHLSVQRLMEASIQSVDSSVAFPYWEYTIDVEEVIAKHGGDFRQWRNVLAFTNEWFGAADPATGRVTEGTFADWTLKGNKFATVSNSYGLIRSPWNNLKDPHFARYFGGGSELGVEPTIFVSGEQMSSCSVLSDTLDKSDTLGAFNGAAAGQAHGPIHMFTGGQSNTKNLVQRMTAIHLDARGKYHNQMWGNGVTFFFANIKSMWRYGLWECPDSCEEDTPQAECACGCDPDAVMASGYKADMLDPISAQWVKTGSVDEDTADTMMYNLVDLMCSYEKAGGVVMGDHASSGAASDPSFWILHGAVERYLQLIRMQDRFRNEDWDEEVFRSNIHPFQDDCSGHHKDDPLVFGAVDGNDFTNGEYYDYLSPKEPNLPYVFDNFLWKHCAALGFDIAQHLPDDDVAAAEVEEERYHSWLESTMPPAPPAHPEDGEDPNPDDLHAMEETTSGYAIPITSGM